LQKQFKNTKIMKAGIITKTLKKVNSQPLEYSLGYRRITSLPLGVRQKINLTCILKKENDDSSMIDFLNNLTDEEFIEWLKLS